MNAHSGSNREVPGAFTQVAQRITTHLTQRDRYRLRTSLRLESSRRIPWQSKILHQHVARAEWNHTHRRACSRHSLQYLKEGSVSAAGKNRIRPTLNRLACLVAGRVGGECVLHLYDAALVAQNRSTALYNGATLTAFRQHRIKKESYAAHIPNMRLREAHDARDKKTVR